MKIFPEVREVTGLHGSVTSEVTTKTTKKRALLDRKGLLQVYFLTENVTAIMFLCQCIVVISVTWSNTPRTKRALSSCSSCCYETQSSLVAVRETQFWFTWLNFFEPRKMAAISFLVWKSPAKPFPSCDLTPLPSNFALCKPNRYWWVRTWCTPWCTPCQRGSRCSPS